MGRSAVIRHDEVRSMLRFLGSLEEQPRDPVLRATFILNELCQFVRAQWGIFTVLTEFRPSGSVRMLHAVQGGSLDEGAATRFFRYVHEQCAADPMAIASMNAQPLRLVRTRPQLVTDKAWYDSAHYTEFRRPAHLDESMYAIHPIDAQGNAIAVGLTRAHGDRRFTERERKMVELLHDGLSWFYGRYYREKGEPTQKGLTPALQRTLSGLLAGESEKQIAYRLKLSRHTIHDHTKLIYRHFHVHSRGELLSRLLTNPT